MLIGNKGALSEYPLKVFTIDPYKVSEELIEKLDNCSKRCNESKAERFLNNRLPDYLNETVCSNHSYLFTDFFTKYWGEKDDVHQRGSNCVVKSALTAIHSISSFYAEHEHQTMTGEHSLSKTVDNPMKKALEDTTEWNNFFLFCYLEFYLNYAEMNPLSLDENLLDSIFVKAFIMKQEVLCKKEIEQLHERYKTLSEIKASLVLKQRTEEEIEVSHVLAELGIKKSFALKGDTRVESSLIPKNSEVLIWK